MLNIVSVAFGLLTLVLGLVAFIPFLGLLNWFVIPIGIVGIVIGALSPVKTGRNLNIILVIILAVRLSLGGGVI